MCEVLSFPLSLLYTSLLLPADGVISFATFNQCLVRFCFQSMSCQTPHSGVCFVSVCVCRFNQKFYQTKPHLNLPACLYSEGLHRGLCSSIIQSLIYATSKPLLPGFGLTLYHRFGYTCIPSRSLSILRCDSPGCSSVQRDFAVSAPRLWSDLKRSRLQTVSTFKSNLR